MWLQIGFVIALSIILFVCLESLAKYLLVRLSFAPKAEFPEIKPESIEKFDSFDSELGWERQPNEQRKKDTGHSSPNDPEADRVTYSTDEYGSRICSKDRESSGPNVATYGDSYCFCRDVQDNETFQHYLSDELETHVSNYGVGNYGVDQALLRLKRRFDDDPADYVVMAALSHSIPRILSVWKHYSEFGNTFAVKPRFCFSGDCLEKIPCIANSREDILQLEEQAEFLRSNDYHYENWFHPRRLYRPYTLRFCRNPANIPHALTSIANFALDSVNIPITIPRDRWDHMRKMEQYEYHEQVIIECEDLYCEIIGEFVEFACSRNAVPLYLPLFSGKYIEYELEHGSIDQSINDRLRSEYPRLHVLDTRYEIVGHIEDISELYSGEGTNGHHSAMGNKLIGESVAAKIRELEEQKGFVTLTD
ncbi:hypothetical protein [Natrarchaeobius oligotrophus]|uniref:hypothetical protein n=1 Tax=Natrarchaeobius oligotrophus TaxID=3455743 RepID=UPI000F549F64|nr:hypothetical protein [Natrarchaeobius chitinivorans]